MFTTKQLHHIHSLLGAAPRDLDEGEIEFTAQDAIALRELVKKELAARSRRAPLPTAVPIDRAEIQAFIEQKGATVCADLHGQKTAKRTKFINEAAERAAAQRDREVFEQLDTEAALAKLGL